MPLQLRSVAVVRSFSSSAAGRAGDDGDDDEWFGKHEEEKRVAAAKPRTLFEKTRRVAESELEEKFIKGGGPGGQKINKTNSCVYLKHVPTGIEVKCQEQRERGRNRTIARQILHEKLMQLYFPEESKTFKRQEKIRRRKERMGRRYGRNEPALLSPSATTASPSSPTSSSVVKVDDGDGGGERSEQGGADGPADPASEAKAPTAQRRRGTGAAGLPDFVLEQLGIRRADVAECTVIDPEELSASSDDDDDDDQAGGDEDEDDDEDDDQDEGSKDDDDHDKNTTERKPRQDKTPTDLPNFLLDQLGIKT